MNSFNKHFKPQGKLFVRLSPFFGSLGLPRESFRFTILTPYACMILNPPIALESGVPNGCILAAHTRERCDAQLAAARCEIGVWGVLTREVVQVNVVRSNEVSSTVPPIALGPKRERREPWQLAHHCPRKKRLLVGRSKVNQEGSTGGQVATSFINTPFEPLARFKSVVTQIPFDQLDLAGRSATKDGCDSCFESEDYPQPSGR